MEEELNYLSEKIQDIKEARMAARQVLGKAIGSKGFKAVFSYLNESNNYDSMTLIIRGYSKEIDILNNILSALTN